MTILSRQDAQTRADEIRIFQRELATLEHDGVVTLDADQRRHIHEHHQNLLEKFARRYDIDRDVQAKQLSLGMRTASFLGALALAASVYYLFHQFWGLFAAPVLDPAGESLRWNVWGPPKPRAAALSSRDGEWFVSPPRPTAPEATSSSTMTATESATIRRPNGLEGTAIV